MSAKVEDAVHLHVQCSRGRTTPFEIDLSGVFFYFTVSHGSVSLTLQVLHEVLINASRCPMTCDPIPSGCTPVRRTVSCLMAAYMQACWLATCAIGVQQASSQSWDTHCLGRLCCAGRQLWRRVD